jgi:hypothetical protein
MTYFITIYVTRFIGFKILAFLPEDGGRQPKHVGRGVHIYIHIVSANFLILPT